MCTRGQTSRSTLTPPENPGDAGTHLFIHDRVLQMAIATKAKQFVASPLVQTVVNEVYSGKIVFSNVATPRSVLADNYKRKAIEVYDHRAAPFLDHYRWVRQTKEKVLCLDPGVVG